MFRNKFPIFQRKINGHRLVYLDNASTTQKPYMVIEAVSHFYKNHNANTHRGISTLSEEATSMYENARDKMQAFINAKHREEIIFTSGTTESINLVANTWGQKHITPQDEILLTDSEHHANLVPWQILAKKKRAKLKFIPMSRNYDLELGNLASLINGQTKLVSLSHIPNTLGTIYPIAKIIQSARKVGAKILIDGAQAGAHIPIDVQKLDADFYAFSGHKMYGPTGVGILYGKKELLEKMSPYQTGGNMVKQVSWDNATWNDLPYKFEAGTANIAGVVGLGSAIDFINQVGLGAIAKHESDITSYLLKQLQNITGINIYGPSDAKYRIGVVSFNITGIPSHDLASILDDRGIAIRSGYHCAMPLHKKLGIDSSIRISLGIYNTKTDIDQLITSIRYAQKYLRLL